ncbi:MAG: DUF4365 domain-containing protein [Microbacterium sp.]|uniref:DUF4365 domain-containing protein n=1 Tax=Microbacterium sp. TaxID=51671 RepID=UPI003F9AD335
MPSEHDLPTRHANHSRSSWSNRAFEHVLPREWVVHALAEDYGIDRRVEVFEDDRTTGIFFNVQLKSTDRGSGHQPAESIKRTTLNYWDQTPDATLVVIAHDSTETLWYRWAHLLPHDENPNTQSRQVQCERILDASSAAELAEEARAWRLARELTRYVPIDVYLTGTTLYGQPAAPLKRAIAQKLATLPNYFLVAHSAPTLPYLQVCVEDTRVMAGLRGNYSQQITWDLDGERDYSVIASDVIASLALSCAHAGAEDLCVQLLKQIASDTRLMEVNAFGYAMSLLTRREENDTVVTLLRRAAAVEDHPARDIALAAIASANPTSELGRAVAHSIRDAARTWTRPAMGLYNAANALRGVDPGESIALYEEAAEADPAYRSRGYWWKEKGSAHWYQRQTDEAVACYREAIELGETQAKAYLADVLMRTGRYREARDTFYDAPIWEAPEDAQWRLSYNALRLIVDELHIDQQDRDGIGIPDFYPSPADHGTEALEATALDAIRADALNGWAYTGLATAWSGNEDKSPLHASVAAAVIINTAGFLWMNLLIDIAENQSEDDESRMRIAHDAMWCARQYFGDSFADEILEYPLLTEEARSYFLEFFEAVRLPSSTLELRRHSDGGRYESDFIPTESRPGR